jgi:multidrug efflux pump subunit AcrB
VDTLIIRTPSGGEMPIGVAATIEHGRAYTTISRTDGRRVVNVTADVEKGVANGPKVLSEMQKSVMPGILQRHAGLSYAFEGANREQSDTLKSLGLGYIFALLLVYGLLAIPFGSYVLPFVVMAAIPFGIVGALAGHLIMGFDMSIISLMGVVALSGVVVNDSLVLIDAANEFRDGGMHPKDAVIAAGARRFRPILLTSLTTFFGLVPMIMETSVQARFLIPMAISLGFGILFATFIILLLVPALYGMAEAWRTFFVEEDPVVTPSVAEDIA